MKRICDCYKEGYDKENDYCPIDRLVYSIKSINLASITIKSDIVMVINYFHMAIEDSELFIINHDINKIIERLIKENIKVDYRVKFNKYNNIQHFLVITYDKEYNPIEIFIDKKTFDSIDIHLILI